MYSRRRAAGRLGVGLLSWVLLQPPAMPSGDVAPDAPLGDWVANGRFETQAECEDTRSQNMAALALALDRGGGGGQGAAVITQARCISVEKLRELFAPPKASGGGD